MAPRVTAARAAGTPKEASAQAALRAAEAKVASARAAYQANLPGAGARKIAANAKAAAQKAKERRAGGAEPSVGTPAPRTPEQVAAAEQKFNAQKQNALDEARHHQLHRRQPALVGARPHSAEVARPSAAPNSRSTAAIGRQNMIGSSPANPRYSGGPANIPRTNPNGGHLPADFDLHTIAESPQEQRLFQQALKNKASSRSPRPNAYQRYLQEIGSVLV